MGSAEPIADGMSKRYVIGVWVELCEDIHRVLNLSIDFSFLTDLCSLDAPKRSQCYTYASLSATVLSV